MNINEYLSNDEKQYLFYNDESEVTAIIVPEEMCGFPENYEKSKRNLFRPLTVPTQAMVKFNFVNIYMLSTGDLLFLIL